MYICTYNVKFDEYKCWTKHAFVYDINFKRLHQSKCCEALIYNISDVPIYVFDDKYRETKKIEIYPYRILWWSLPCGTCLKNNSMLVNFYNLYIFIEI